MNRSLMIIWLLAALLALSTFAGAATITGTVKQASDDSPIVGATVMVITTGIPVNTVASTTTGVGGTYSLTGLGAGSFFVAAYDDTHYAAQKPVTLTADGSAVADFRLSAIQAPTRTVFDTFSRPDSDALGATEDAGAYPWLKNTNITCLIGNNKMVISGGGWGGASVGGDFLPADVDMSVRVVCPQTNFGVTYRHSQPGSSHAGGYMVCTAGNRVRLWRSDVGDVIPMVTVPGLTWGGAGHILRVKAMGIRHQAFVDGALVFDVINSLNVSGGYVGFSEANSAASFDDFTCSQYVAPSTGVIRGTVTETGSNSLLPNVTVRIKDGKSTTTDAQGKYILGELAAANYNVYAYDDTHYVLIEAGVAVEDGGTTTLDFQLTPVPAWTTAATDTFSRPDSPTPGVTEDDNHYPWISGYSPTASVSIEGQRLYLKEPAGAWFTTSLANVAVADFDMSAKLDLSYAAVVWGLTYRQPVGGRYDGGGYLVYLSGGNTTLWWQGNILAIGPGTLEAIEHVMRVKAVGVRHQVWLDNVPVIDYIHEAGAQAGYLGIQCTWGELKVDDFNAYLGALWPMSSLQAGAGECQRLPNNAYVNLGGGGSGPVVTATFGDHALPSDDYVYVEDKSRAGGIRVNTGGVTGSLSVGDELSLRGAIGVSDGEKQVGWIWDWHVLSNGNVIKPLSTKGASIGDGAGIGSKSGLTSMGMLMNVCGSVTSVSPDSTSFYINDGSSYQEAPGLQVIVGNAWVVPGVNNYVICTGVVGTAAGPVPVIRLRDSSDLIILR